MVIIIDLVLLIVFSIVYAWMFYNIPVLAVGVWKLRKSKHLSGKVGSKFEPLPSFSVILPVKNEQKVVSRVLEAVLNLDYPVDKVEVVVVEDGSDDGTLEVCKKFANEHGNVKVFQRSFSSGKPSALNYGLANCSGNIVCFFDADSVPERDALQKVSEYFADPSVAAVQGRTLSINSHENMLTRFISYEEAVWFEAYLQGKDSLGLFVHLKGSCQFLRRDVLKQAEGFDENFIADDMEISAKLTERGKTIRYASDVRSWQESPADLKALFRQRTRWFRGTIEVAFKYGRLMSNLNRRTLDAEATLMGPFILIASLFAYLAASGVFFIDFPYNILWNGIMGISILATTSILLLSGLALIYVSKPRRIGNILWLPFVFGYWFLQAFIALYAALLVLLKRPKKWLKTEKSGAVVSPYFVSEGKKI